MDENDESSPTWSHAVAGVSASTPAALNSALLKAEQLEPHFVAFVERSEPIDLFEATPTDVARCEVWIKDL